MRKIFGSRIFHTLAAAAIGGVVNTAATGNLNSRALAAGAVIAVTGLYRKPSVPIPHTLLAGAIGGAVNAWAVGADAHAIATGAAIAAAALWKTLPNGTNADSPESVQSSQPDTGQADH